MEEASVPGPKGAQEIINRWRLFNRGESLVAHMHQFVSSTSSDACSCASRGKGRRICRLSPWPMLIRINSSRWLKTKC